MAEPADKKTPAPPQRDPPGSWWHVRRLVRRALAPAERFLAIEAASGMLLLAAAAIALIWANSPWRESGYLETAKVGILVGSGLAAILAYALGRVILPPKPPPLPPRRKRQPPLERQEQS